MQLEAVSGVLLAVQVLILAMTVTPLHSACELTTHVQCTLVEDNIGAVNLSMCFQDPLLAIL